MSLRTKCPHCEREAVLAAEVLGKSVKCKGCGKPFAVKPASKNGSGSDPEHLGGGPFGSAGIRSAAKSPPGRRPLGRLLAAVADDALDRPGAIGFVTLLASVLAFVLIVNRHPTPLPLAVAKMKPPVVEAAPAVVNPPPKVEPKPEPPKPEPKVDPKPETKVDVKPETKIDPPSPPRFDRLKIDPPVVTVAPGNLYGDQGGEQVAAAVRLPHTQLRGRADDTFYRMDNPRVGPNGANPRGSFLVHFRMLQRNKQTATHLIMRYADNRTDIIAISNTVEKDSGTIKVTKDSNYQFPEDIECFLVRIDRQLREPRRTTWSPMQSPWGSIVEPTRPRNWMPDEIARYTKETPVGLKENAFPGVGVDTEFAGTSQGGVSRCWVDPKGHVLGLEYRPGAVGGRGVPRRPAADLQARSESILLSSSTVAREGYAVSGMEVQYRNNVDAIKLHFRKIRPDGSLDPNDAHEGEWIGFPDRLRHARSSATRGHGSSACFRDREPWSTAWCSCSNADHVALGRLPSCGRSKERIS